MSLAVDAHGATQGSSLISEAPINDPQAFVRRKGPEARLSLTVRNARCGGCLKKIETAVRALPGVSDARLNLSTGRLDVAWSGSLPAARITDAVSALGYNVSPVSESPEVDAHRNEERSLLLAMGVAGFAAANIMLLSISVWSGHGEMGEATRTALHAISGVIALPALLYSGQPFFRSAYSVLRRGRTNMDVPISLALVLAFTISAAETLQRGEHAYFDAATMLVFFLLVGRFLDARVRRRAYAAARDLAALANRSVTRLFPNGRAEAVPANAVAPGDLILLAPGERAVVDLVIEKGRSDFDDSLVTGESIPRPAGPGAKVFAGAVNLGQPVTGRAMAAAADSLLADVGRMLEAGEQRRSTYRQIADRAVSLYVPFVHSAALITFAAWLVSGASLREAILVAVSTLIITCPCALALAAPVAQVVAAGRLFRAGTYLRSGDALERLAHCDHVVLDKTGTLTLGSPRLVSQNVSYDLLQAAARLARASRHPLSRALAAAAGPGDVADNVEEYPGRGLAAEIDGVACRLGSPSWLGVSPASASGLVLAFIRGSDPPALFYFSDELQPGADQSVQALARLGLDVEIVSGDRPEAVREVAATLGIGAWRAGASPVEKAARLDDLCRTGRTVLMVGDGLNDAGALALAHASAAPGGALDISQSASDAVYAGGLASLPFLIRMARHARSVMLQNFAFAAVYNALAIPLAALGHVTPLVAAVAMSGSSIIVVLNALRLNLVRSTLG